MYTFVYWLAVWIPPLLLFVDMFVVLVLSPLLFLFTCLLCCFCLHVCLFVCLQGWSKYNAFHVCITSYNIAVQDHRAFKQKRWKYLVLDEVWTLSFLLPSACMPGDRGAVCSADEG